MSKEGLPAGQLFSRVYIDKGAAVTDSKRFRARAASLLSDYYFSKLSTATLILREIGVKVPNVGVSGRPSYAFDTFILKAEVRDLLDGLTLIFRSIEANDKAKVQASFRAEIERMMREENLGYRMDAAGGIHFYVDEEFERVRSATIAGLANERYTSAREALEDAHRALLAGDTLAAVRRSFDAVENVFKLRFGVSRLGASEIKAKLNPTFGSHYLGRVTDAAVRLAAAFAEWTNAAHQFRHAPGGADPSPPPMDIAILMISEASNYLRWLASLEAA